MILVLWPSLIFVHAVAADTNFAACTRALGSLEPRVRTLAFEPIDYTVRDDGEVRP